MYSQKQAPANGSNLLWTYPDVSGVVQLEKHYASELIDPTNHFIENWLNEKVKNFKIFQILRKKLKLN